MTGELAERTPFESARIDRERFDDIAAASLKRKNCEDHQREAEPDRPPVFFQIKFFPAPTLWLCGLTARIQRPHIRHGLASSVDLRHSIRAQPCQYYVFFLRTILSAPMFCARTGAE